VRSPEIAENATLTETAAVLESYDATTDPNAIHDVLLADTLTTDAAFVSAAPHPDRLPTPAGGGEIAWNLGDIPPMGSVTATLTLVVPASVADVVALDTGATAWGTLEGRAVSASACPVTLSPSTLGTFLQSTAGADLGDEYVARLAGQLCPNPATAFEYVRALGYEVYKGSLRGARGTQWSQAGNSLDKSNLLVATLRSNGIPARYRHGTLSTERAQELILSMFPTTGAIVGYVPEEAEVSDPANDPRLLAEARDHWWVEAYLDGAWVAMDPSFSYATPGQTFTDPVGSPLGEVPDALRHKVTVTVEVEHYDMLSYLLSGFTYETPLTYTFTTAELVGNPLTLEHLMASETPPMGCLIFCWTYYTYVPYLRLGNSVTVIEGHPFWELLSNFPLGQFAVTAEWVHFDVQDADGNVTRYTHQIADRVKVGPPSGILRQPKMVKALMTADVLSSLGPGTLPLVHQLDSHTIYFNPSWISKEYAAHVGEDLVVAMPKIARVAPIAASLGDVDRVMAGEYHPNFGVVELAEATELVDGTTQAFDQMMGVAYVALSDDTAQDLADTSLVRAYPDAPRITIASSVISLSAVISQAAQVQILDLLADGVRVVAYPGQARSAEQVYRMTRGVSDTFLESSVGEMLTGEQSRSAANILQAAQAQGISLAYVDANRLDVLNGLEIPTQAKAFILDAAQRGYGVLVPERMVALGNGQAIAWWQLNLETGEMVGVGQDGTHQFMVTAPFEIMLTVTIILLVLTIAILLIARYYVWRNAAMLTWDYFWRHAVPGASGAGMTQQQIYEQALRDTKAYMRNTVWPEFERLWGQTYWSNWVPPEWLY
jgi:transglutaminase-like putative cysteine protease